MTVTVAQVQEQAVISQAAIDDHVASLTVTAGRRADYDTSAAETNSKKATRTAEFEKLRAMLADLADEPEDTP